MDKIPGKKIGEDFDAALNEISNPPLGKDEFTVNMVMQHLEASREVAQRVVKKMVAAEKAVYVGMRYVNGNNNKAYRLVKGKKK